MSILDKDCRELPGRCDPCEGLDGFDWNQEISLTYDGLIRNPEELRYLIGNPSDDPQDLSGFVTDEELQSILDRQRELLDEIAERRMADQRVQTQAAIDIKIAELEGAEAKQDFLKDSKSQGLKTAVATAEKMLEVDVARMTEEYVREGLPDKAASYFDEVEVPIVPSPTIDKVSYGFIPEPYLPSHVATAHGVTIKSPDGELYPASADGNIQRTAMFSSLFPARRYQIRGRYLYVTNNEENVESVFAWLTTRTRVEDFAREISQANISLTEATEALKEFDENPTTEADPEVAAIERAIVELCVDPPVLSGDELIADLVSQVNQEIRQEAMMALQSSAQITNQTQAAPDA